MKFAVLQENLDRTLGIVRHAVARRSTLAVLENVLLGTTEQGTVLLTTTDLQIMMTCAVQARVDEPGSVTIPFSTLSKFVAKLPPERIDIEVDLKRSSMDLTCAQFEATVMGLSADEYPTVSEFPEDLLLSMEPDAFVALVGQVAYAAATDTGRPVLEGVSVTADDGSLTFAAADGFRLAVNHALVDWHGDASAVIPARALKVAAGFVRHGEDRVDIAIADSKVYFRQSAELVSNLIEGRFPDYNAIVPSEHTTRVVVGVGALSDAIGLASVFSAGDAGQLVMLKVESDAQTVAVSAVDAERGNQRGEVPATVEGESLEIGFNATYLAEALSAMASEKVEMKMTTPSSPIALRGVGGTGVHVVMPQLVARLA